MHSVRPDKATSFALQADWANAHPQEVELIIAQTQLAGLDPTNSRVEFFTWRDLEYEKFGSKEFYGWHVNLARLLSESGQARKALSDVAYAHKGIVESNRKDPIDLEFVKRVDLSKREPVLCVSQRLPGRDRLHEIMIDGNHRLYAAHIAGIQGWPALVLSEEASRACELPPSFIQLMIEKDG